MGCTCGKEVVEIEGKSYVVRSRLAEGGFSVVDLVEDTRSHTSYALKRITCHSKSDQRAVIQEIEFHNALSSSPYIIDCHGSAVNYIHLSDDDMSSEVLILLPLYRRGTLQDQLNMRMKSKCHMQEAEVLKMFKKLCLGVSDMHNAKPVSLAHRDIKPANVLLSVDDIPVWMDLGSMGNARIQIKGNSEALALQDLAAEKCSMPYRAPELFNVETFGTIDERVDIWSLGCLLYALCYFKSPFDATYEKGDSVALAVISGHIHFPEDSMYSSSLHDFITSMLAVNVLERPFIEWVIQQTDMLLANIENRV